MPSTDSAPMSAVAGQVALLVRAGFRLVSGAQLRSADPGWPRRLRSLPCASHPRGLVQAPFHGQGLRTEWGQQTPLKALTLGSVIVPFALRPLG